MAKWNMKPIQVDAYVIKSVSPMMDDGGRDLTIDFNGKDQLRHADPKMLALYEPSEGDYWIEYMGRATVGQKKGFEDVHTLASTYDHKQVEE